MTRDLPFIATLYAIAGVLVLVLIFGAPLHGVAL